MRRRNLAACLLVAALTVVGHASSAAAEDIHLGDSVSDVVLPDAEPHKLLGTPATRHTFEADAGTRVRIDMDAEFDAYVVLGVEVGDWSVADDDSGEGTNPRLEATLPETTVYEIWVTSRTGGHGGYLLVLTPLDSAE